VRIRKTTVQQNISTDKIAIV